MEIFGKLIIRFVLTFLLGIHPIMGWAQKKKVLVLHSYHQGLNWTDNITKGITSVFESYPEIEAHFEYLDSKRNVDASYLEQLRHLYKAKYHKIPFEVILVSDNNALSFIKEYRSEFFQGIPVVFCGIDQFSYSRFKDMYQITGVTEQVDFKRNAELILELHPNIREIVIINDNETVSAKINREFIRGFWSDLKTKVEYRFLESVSISELLQQLDELDESSVILLTNFSRDRLGNYISYRENIELIKRVTSVPVYSGWEFYLGKGIVGGMLTSGNDQGRIAAEMVVDIIQGTNVDDIPIVHSGYNKMIFDYRLVKKNNIDINLIPKEGVIINQPPGFFIRNRNYIYGFSGFVVLLILLLLNNEVRNRRRAARLLSMNRELDKRVYEKTFALQKANAILKEKKQQIIQQNIELDDHRNNLIDLVKKRTQDLELANVKLTDNRRRLLMMLDANSDGVWEYNLQSGKLRMGKQIWKRLGYTEDEIIEQIDFIDSLIHPEDLQLVKQNQIDHIIGLSKVYASEFRIKNSDGAWIWFLSRGKILEWDDRGEAKLMVGTHTDITEQKIADQMLLEEEKRWRSLFEQTHEGIVIIGLKGNIIEANPAAADLLQCSIEELSSMSIINFVVESTVRENLKSFMLKSELKRKTFSYDTMVKRKDFSTFPAEILLSQIDYSGLYLWMVTFRDISKRQEVERQVLNAVIKTEEKERSRFARDLHDTIGPLLSGMKLYLATLEKTKSDERRKKVFALSEEAINEAISSIREISNNLSPQILTDYGVVSALRGFLQRISATKMIEASLDAKGMDERINQEVELALYRIITELINNTIKHSEASKISIFMTREKNEVSVDYRDDGKGLQDSLALSEERGMGLSNIQNRLKSVDGRLSILNETKWGFIAHLVIPL